MSERLGNTLAWIRTTQHKEAIRQLALDQHERELLAVSKYQTKRYHHDPGYGLRKRWQARLGHWMRKGGLDKPSRFGCSTGELRDHIAKQFKQGMDWSNFGTVWEVDHVVPCCHFTLPQQIASAFHFTNLRPRLKSLNRLDGLRLARTV